MPDTDFTPDDLGADDAMTIGIRVVEMADRVKAMHTMLPGAQASWAFEMDGTRFGVVVTVVSDDSN
ncbi:hypothetical protein V5F40_22895 [Xanthobacter sp. DSM 14520]|uniref:hypothetical protein n=1 Tax=Xanthobacter autotrophicus (strain ATCC BAA-1158 / Py2) TaxID=78245 RepID=UPI00372AA27D